MKHLKKTNNNALVTNVVFSKFNKTKSISKIQYGFTLVEVLIALVISSIALLGLAAGQLKSLQYATNSFNYTVSLVQANNAVERTWANLCDIQSGITAYDAAYSAANFQPQIGAYSLVAIPAPGAAFSDNLNISVSWSDARMADPNISRISIDAVFLSICRP